MSHTKSIAVRSLPARYSGDGSQRAFARFYRHQLKRLRCCLCLCATRGDAAYDLLAETSPRLLQIIRTDLCTPDAHIWPLSERGWKHKRNAHPDRPSKTSLTALYD